MRRILGVLTIIGISLPILSAQVQTPEIDPTFGVSAVALLAGAAIVVRGYFKR